MMVNKLGLQIFGNSSRSFSFTFSSMAIFTERIRSMGEGYVSTSMCVHRRGGVLASPAVVCRGVVPRSGVSRAVSHFSLGGRPFSENGRPPNTGI